MKKLSYLFSIGLLVSMLSLTGCGGNGGNEAETPPATTTGTNSSSQQQTKDTPTEKIGLQGEYDRSGLAKRVLKALENNPELANVKTVHVAQKGSTVVLKGKAPSQAVLDKIVSVAREVEGVTEVETAQVTINP